MRHRGVILALAAGLVAPAAAASLPYGIDAVSVVDLHVDLSYRVNFQGGTLAQGSGQMVARRAGMLRGVVLPLFVPHRVSATGPRAEDLERSYARMTELIPRTPPYSPSRCVPFAGPTREVQTWFAFEGSAPLATEEGAVERWVQRGARFFGLVHTTDNVLATSSTNKDARAPGLTELGRTFVKRVHRAGGIVDVSHASDQAFADVVAIALEDGVPVVATHSNARALAPNPRNLTDDQLRAIARTGGIAGVNFHSPFLVPSGRARIDDVVRHIAHMVAVAGPAHVAIGSDFEGDITPPLGLENAEKYRALAKALRTALPLEQIKDVFSRNALRILCPAKPAQ